MDTTLNYFKVNEYTMIHGGNKLNRVKYGFLVLEANIFIEELIDVTLHTDMKCQGVWVAKWCNTNTTSFLSVQFLPRIQTGMHYDFGQ